MNHIQGHVVSYAQLLNAKTMLSAMSSFSPMETIIKVDVLFDTQRNCIFPREGVALVEWIRPSRMLVKVDRQTVVLNTVFKCIP